MILRACYEIRTTRTRVYLRLEKFMDVVVEPLRLLATLVLFDQVCVAAVIAAITSGLDINAINAELRKPEEVQAD